MVKVFKNVYYGMSPGQGGGSSTEMLSSSALWAVSILFLQDCLGQMKQAQTPSTPSSPHLNSDFFINMLKHVTFTYIAVKEWDFIHLNLNSNKFLSWLTVQNIKQG